jgi:glucose/arabinose dehydrogenase
LKRWTAASGVNVVANGLATMGNIAVDANGRPIVTEDGGHRVFRIGPNGEKTVIAGNGQTFGGGDGFPAIETGLNRVRGVACLPNGGIFLATQKGSHIWYVDTAGIIHKAIDCASTGAANFGNNQSWTTPGIKMSEPRAIAVAPNGDLLITASDYGQIRVVKCLRPPSPPAALALEPFTAGTRRLRWNGVPWQSYLVEHTPGLSPANWQTIGVRTAEPSADSLHPLPVNPASQGYYRLRMPR